MTETRHYHNEATQAEKLEVLKDSYLTRAAADADLASQGRFKRETTTRVTGVPVHPSLPESSPWSSGFDQNLEAPLGFAVDEAPAQSNLEVVGVEPSPGVDDLGGSMAPTDVSQSDVETGPPKSMKRRSW